MPPDAPGPPGVDPVIRIKTPEEGSTSWKAREVAPDGRSCVRMASWARLRSPTRTWTTLSS